MKLVLFLLFLIFITETSFAYTEMDLDFSYDKQIYGNSSNNYILTRSYGISMARYFSRNIAFEINYSDISQDQSENDEVSISDTDLSLTSVENNVSTRIYGAGLRFVFGNRSSFFLPMFSVGYAVQEVEDYTNYTFKDSSSGSSVVYHGDTTTAKESSIFSSFALKIKLAERFSIKGSVKTVFPAFEFNKAKNYLQYAFGISCIL